MNDHRLFVKCMILLGICVYISVCESSDNNHEQENTILNSIIAKLNRSNPVALAEMEKEPKFFDEFECKYKWNCEWIEWTTIWFGFGGKLESEKVNLAQFSREWKADVYQKL